MRIASSLIGLAWLIYLVAHIAKIDSPHDRLMEAMSFVVTVLLTSALLGPLKKIDAETSIAERRLIALLRTTIFTISGIGLAWVIWSVGAVFGTSHWRTVLVLLVMAVNIGLIYFYNSRVMSRQTLKDDRENHGRI